MLYEGFSDMPMSVITLPWLPWLVYLGFLDASICHIDPTLLVYAHD